MLHLPVALAFTYLAEAEVKFLDILIAEAVKVIGEQCRQRVEYISTPLEGAPMPIPIATPIPVGGATVFAIKAERFEEF